MCGIAGEVSFGRRPVSSESVREMCRLMVHRGPDEEGYHESAAASLGIRRLKVIGLVNGSQPVYDTNSTAVCIFNGEVYNYRELRDELEGEGYVFRTSTDAEVIVHLYDKLGISFVKKLRGMFAVAIYDARLRRLVLARDPTGKKPLNYHVTPEGNVIFASELQPLASHPALDRRVNFEAVDRFLSFRIIPAPLTIYRDVYKVMPGTVMVFEDGRQSADRYWSFDFTPRLEDEPEEELVERLKRALVEAVEVRLQSEVPLGALLSGGLDSSLVVSIMARLLERKIHTFSIGFREREFDELSHARLVSDYCGTIHHQYVITPGSALEIIGRLLAHFGEPYAFPSVIACYYMNRLARDYVTVVLTGDGADELFCGYNRYKIFADLPTLPARPESLTKVDVELLRSARAGDIAAEYQSVLTDGLRDSLKRRLYSRGFIEQLPGRFPANYLYERFAGNAHLGDRLVRALDVDSGFWLRDAQLVKIDIASMANSVEVRCPMLDPKVVELATGIGIKRKLVGSNEKQILKKAAGSFLPAEIIERRKQELAVPLESWLAVSLRGEISRTLLSDESLSRGYFDPDRMIDFVKNYDVADSYAVWTLYVLERWHQLNEVAGPCAVEAEPNFASVSTVDL